MRRRHFLLAGAALMLPACGPLPEPAPRPSIPPGPALPSDAPPLTITPPGPDAVPKSFLPIPQWPDAAVQARIIGIHRHHLCAAVLRDETHAYPVVVDVTGPTTHVILSDQNGTFTTRDVGLDLLAAHLDPTVEQPELGHPLCSGAAILDDEHAYLVVGRPVSINDPLLTLHLLRIDLSDGTVTASALLSERFTVAGLEKISLAFSSDHTSLLVAGNDLLTPPNVFGLRLGTTDLAVQFDVDGLIPEGARVSVAGEALTTVTEHDQNLVLLADGRNLTVPSTGHLFVLGQWCYHETSGHQVMLRDLTTGVETPLPDLSDVGILDLKPLPWSIWSASAHLMFMHRHKGTEKFSVWLPGATSPLLQWEDNEHPAPDKCSVHGNTLYSGLDDSLEIRSLDSGEILASSPWGIVTSGIAVSTWGVATNEHFFPANEWF